VIFWSRGAVCGPGRQREKTSQVAGFFAVTIATAALMGWWVATDAVELGRGLCSHQANDGLVSAFGLALVPPGKNSRLACAVGLAMAAIAALDLLGRFAIDTGINLLNRLLVARSS
jgi:hypothetical protein